MLKLRLWHSYLGLFIAPSVLFFALTGALQLFSLHEAHDSYEPPALLEKLGSVHKDQVFEQKHDHDSPKPAVSESAPAEDAPAAGHDDAPPRVLTWILKWFFAVIALCLIASTAIGLWMGLKFTRNKRLAWSLLIAGIIIPLALIVL